MQERVKFEFVTSRAIHTFHYHYWRLSRIQVAHDDSGCRIAKHTKMNKT